MVVSSVFYLRSQLPKQTIQNQKELIETYEKRLKALEDQSEQDKKQHIENVKAIADLQGQLKVYKEIPLQEIANSMKELSATNKQILTYIHTPAKVTEQTIKTTQKG